MITRESSSQTKSQDNKIFEPYKKIASKTASWKVDICLKKKPSLAQIFRYFCYESRKSKIIFLIRCNYRLFRNYVQMVIEQMLWNKF